MVRALVGLGVLLCGLGVTAPASADVIYFKQRAPIPQAMRDLGWGFPFTHPTSGIVYQAYMGRIARVVPNVFPTQIEFEPARVKMVNVSWSEPDPRFRQQPKVQWAGARNVSVINLSDLRRIDHEFDGFQDLRFVFSNRDDLLNSMTSRKVNITGEPFRTYFLAAGGVPVADHMRRLSASQRAAHFAGFVSGGGALRRIPPAGLQEGWLVTWLNRGPLTSANRARLLQDAFGPRQRLVPPYFVRDPAGFHPIQRESDVRTLVLSILRAGAQDYRYSRPGPRGEAPTNPRGAFGMGVTGSGDSNFFLICINMISGLCDLVDESHPNAQAMGFMARDAVLTAIERATLGRSYTPPPASRRPQLTSAMHLDPSDMAVVALAVVSRNPSWGTARFDTVEGRDLDRNWASIRVPDRPVRPRPGRRLIRALLGLAREPNDRREARANDRLRVRAATGVPGYGNTSELKARLVRVLEKIMLGPGRTEYLRHTTDVLAESVAQVVVRRGGGGRLMEDQHTISVRRFAQMVIGRSGHSEPFIMEEVVKRLFSIALMPDGDRAGPGKTLRDLIRRDAIASLSHLASLGERSKRNQASPDDGVDDELVAHPLAVGEYETISSMVFERVTTLLEQREQGFGSHSDEQFFRALGVMAHQTIPARPLEGHAATFQSAYERRMRLLLNQDPARRERVRELEKLMRAPAGQ